MTRRSILVYHPEPGEAQAYARLIKQTRPTFSVAVCATPAEAEARIADAEILYAWNFPSELLPRAARLRWVQNMGAGVERFMVPELSRRVTVRSCSAPSSASGNGCRWTRCVFTGRRSA